MRFSYYPSQCAQNSLPVMQAALNSLRKQGHTVHANSMDSDIAIVWSVLWHGRMGLNQQVWKTYQDTGRPVVVFDIGALSRGITWKVALTNINADGYYGHKERLDLDRPNKLGISLTKSTTKYSNILIAGQHAKSLQVVGLGRLEEWVNTQITQLRQVTDRPIVVRPHPRSNMNRNLLPSDIIFDTPQPVVNTYDSFNMHFQYYAVVNHNSGPGIQAAIAGVRPIVDVSSLAYPVSNDMKDIEQPYTPDREQWLIEICHTEYTVNEIEQGIWLDRLHL
jgi:hypothetical protein